MLKTTEPKVLAEASNDKVWGTGISLRDSQALNTNKWSGKGWLSNMLTIIRDEYQPWIKVRQIIYWHYNIISYQLMEDTRTKSLCETFYLLALLYTDAFWHYNPAKGISGSHQR